MAKRFTDSRKWDDPWFLELPLEYKMTWIHILDKCDHAGIYKVNVKMINFCLNIKLTKNDLEKAFVGRFYKINNHKWFISKFIEFQYGVLSEKNRVHNSVIEILKKEGLYKVYTQTLIGLKDKDKEKNKDKVKVKNKKKDKANPEVKIFLDDFCNTFREKTGGKYNVKGVKEGAIIKNLLNTYSLSDLQIMKDLFFQSTDPFILKAGYSIGVFYSQINKLISTGKSNQPGIAAWVREMQKKVEGNIDR